MCNVVLVKLSEGSVRKQIDLSLCIPLMKDKSAYFCIPHLYIYPLDKAINHRLIDILIYFSQSKIKQSHLVLCYGQYSMVSGIWVTDFEVLK